MSAVRNQLVQVIDCLPEAEQILLFEIAKRFAYDDIATESDLIAIRSAREEFISGETINHNAINWE